MPGEDIQCPPKKFILCLLYLPCLTGWLKIYIHFRIFKTKVEFAFNGTYRNNANEAKVSAILNWVGNSAFEVYKNFVWTLPANKNDPAKMLTHFKNYFNLHRMSTIAGTC